MTTETNPPLTYDMLSQYLTAFQKALGRIEAIAPRPQTDDYDSSAYGRLVALETRERDHLEELGELAWKMAGELRTIEETLDNLARVTALGRIGVDLSEYVEGLHPLGCDWRHPADCSCRD